MRRENASSGRAAHRGNCCGNWRWRNGIADEDLPWTQALAEAAMRASLRAAYRQVLGALGRSEPHDWALRGLFVNLQQLQHTPAIPTTNSPRHSMDQVLLFFDSGSLATLADVELALLTCVWTPTETNRSSYGGGDEPCSHSYHEHPGGVCGVSGHGPWHATDKRLQPLTVVGDSLMITTSSERIELQETCCGGYRARVLTDTLGVTQWRHHVRAFNKMANCAANLAMNTKSSVQMTLPCTRPFRVDLATHLHEDVAEWQVQD